jgi:hypothetical protein
MTNAQFTAGTREEPLGDPKAGVSAELDALAAYVASLNSFALSPNRNADGSLTAAAVAGRQVFQSMNCASCHGGTAFTNSANANPEDVGTINADSGKRLDGPLTGIDIPTLRDVWATAPYLHRGSAATIGDAIRAHAGVTIGDGDLANLTAFVSQIGSQEASASGGSSVPNTGTGLAGSYFNNTTLAGAAALQRTEQVNFSWSGSPGAGVGADQFSVRWTGKVEALATGTFQFQTKSNAGVRLWINGNLMIDNWTSHPTTNDTSGNIALTKNQRYTITMEFYDTTATAVAKLFWKKPGATAFSLVPTTRLYAN